MQCLGRTARLSRCKRDARTLVCYQHRYQTYALSLSVLTVIGLIAGLYQDLARPILAGDETVQTIEDNTAQTIEQVAVSKDEVVAVIREEQAATRDTIESTGLASLETLFSLTARIERDVDSTIMRVNGHKLQQVYSYDHSRAMELFWGDRFEYYAYSTSGGGSWHEPRVNRHLPLYLVLKSAHTEQTLSRHRLRIGDDELHTILIPGSSPDPMLVFIENPEGEYGWSIKIRIMSTDRERARERFREALTNSGLADRVRQEYKAVSVPGLRLRSGPGLEEEVMRKLRLGTYVKVLESESGWHRVRLPEGRIGWVSADYLEEIT